MNKNYIIVLLIALITIILIGFGAYYVSNQSSINNPQPILLTPTVVIQPPTIAFSPTPAISEPVPDGVTIKVAKEYVISEEITFTITNTTGNDVYYYPESCARSLVHVVSATNNKIMRGEQKMCLMEPRVATLSPNDSISSTISESIRANMTPGQYKIQFTYSLEKRDRFGLGETQMAETDVFILK